MTVVSIQMRHIMLGEGRPKVAVPITGHTSAEILEQARVISEKQPDIVEWRIDFWNNVLDANELESIANNLRHEIGEIALLTTFRTYGEGGEMKLSDSDYFKICRNVISLNLTDAIDLELFHDKTKIDSLLDLAKDQGIVSIMSSHDFKETPKQNVIVDRLKEMVDAKADVAKIAVMPKNVNDLLVLLKATNEASSILSKPIITMSMGSLGKTSRVTGEIFGSSVTFATVEAASAPGQIPIERLRAILDDLYLD
ncbi:type I 3-dehydroquinate dehydratase [Loigolactobacillus coryniformis]|jgi:3-dehydroquinate dehydratase-1|uniref:type I 3-dehydroquinate dehydratase n=1 Tax=Loigolactobacillus coryniformis TaxID=1610 RepID=UPI00201A671F|nr:type I 3-dehydroquinate dehydratase [Loigolactobacillus coryniformis]MCL5457338.1 type I 3-dehydroquinate dehydratase [Loigolactobacillus coryniformis]